MTDDLDDRIRAVVRDSVRDAPTTIADRLVEPAVRASHRRGWTLVAVVAAAAVLIVVGIGVVTRGDDPRSIRPVVTPPTPATTVPDPIEYRMDSDAVVIQLGDYDLGDNIDGFVNGPSLVVYGDGTALKATYDESIVQRTRLSPAAIRGLLEAARSLPIETVVGGDVVAEDAKPRILVVRGARWEVWEANEEITAFEESVRDAFDVSEPTTWMPDAWFERPYGGDCRVVDTPTLEYPYVAAVFPHVMVDHAAGGCGQNSSSVEASPVCTEFEFTGYDETGSMHTAVAAAPPLDVTIVPSTPEVCTTGSLDVTVTVRNTGEVTAAVEPQLILSGGVNKYPLADWPAFDLAAGRTETLYTTVFLPPVPPGEYALYLYGYDGTSPLTVLGPERERVCTPSDLTAVIGEHDGAGGNSMIPITLHNSGIGGDCTIPRSARVRFSTADGSPVEAVGPRASPFGDGEPLLDDLVPAGGTAGLLVVDSSGCLTTPTTPRIGMVVAVLELPGGSELQLGSFEAMCALSYTHVGIAPE